MIKTGDRVRFRFNGGPWMNAVVELASRNGRAAMLTWDDGIVNGYCGAMPVLMAFDGFRDLVAARPVEIELTQ